MENDRQPGRNEWLKSQASALTTLHLSIVLDAYEPQSRSLNRQEVEDINGLTFEEARERGYPNSLLRLNALGIVLADQISSNHVLPKILEASQTENFERYTFFGDPQLVQREYVSTFFTFTGRLCRSYTDTLRKEGIDPRSLTLSNYADLIETDFFNKLIGEALSTAITFWAIIGLESLVDMEEKDRRLKDVLSLDDLLVVNGGVESGWPAVDFQEKLLRAMHVYMVGVNRDKSLPQSVGCPMKFKSAALELDDTTSNRYLSPGQISLIVGGENSVGELSGTRLTLNRSPINEMISLFAEQLRRVDS